MRATKLFFSIFLGLHLWTTAAVAAESADDKAVQKVIKALITSIRYNKDDLAAKQLAFAPMSKLLMDDAWATMKEPERQEFAANLEALIRGLSFTKGREMFQYLDAVLYDPVKVQGDKAHCKSTVVIHRDLKKTEIPIEWVLVKDGGQWKVVDTVSLGESTTQGIREEQIKPLVKEGGVAGVLAAMRKKMGELKKS